MFLPKDYDYGISTTKGFSQVFYRSFEKDASKCTPAFHKTLKGEIRPYDIELLIFLHYAKYATLEQINKYFLSFRGTKKDYFEIYGLKESRERRLETLLSNHIVNKFVISDDLGKDVKYPEDDKEYLVIYCLAGPGIELAEHLDEKKILIENHLRTRDFIESPIFIFDALILTDFLSAVLSKSNSCFIDDASNLSDNVTFYKKDYHMRLNPDEKTMDFRIDTETEKGKYEITGLICRNNYVGSIIKPKLEFYRAILNTRTRVNYFSEDTTKVFIILCDDISVIERLNNERDDLEEYFKCRYMLFDDLKKGKTGVYRCQKGIIDRVKASFF